MIAILLAAGYATRLYPLTKDKPKSLLPLGSKLIIDYIMDEIDKLPNLNRVILVTNSRFAGQFEDWASSCDRSGKAPISVLDDGTTNNDNRLGAIGDIIFTIKKENIDEDLAIFAGDNIFTYSLTDMYAFFKEKNAPTLIAINVPDVEQRRKLAIAEIAEDGQVLDMVEARKFVEDHDMKREWDNTAGQYYAEKQTKSKLYQIWMEEKKSVERTPENYAQTCEEYKDR